MLPRLVNELWMLSGLPARMSFMRSARRVVQTQHKYLMELVSRNRSTDFGRQHNFSQIRTVADFQQQVPTRTCEEFKTWIDSIAEGHSQALTVEPVRLLQPTSGTISGRKLIPFNSALAGEFQQAIRVWTGDMLLKHPSVRSGTAYWSISPAMDLSAAQELVPAGTGGIPIGFASDLSYVGWTQRQLARRLMAVPAELGQCADVDAWRFWTLFHLLRAQDLALISVWSPTFLLELVNDIDHLAESLTRAIATDIRDPITGRIFRHQSKLAKRIEKILETQTNALSAVTRLWPRLKLVSCWADASSTELAQYLQEHLPGVTVQPKGLMATEACITFPLTGLGNVLAIESHFFEFEAVDSTRTIALPQELKVGERYQVLITNGGGLYRYRMHDVVEVTGFIYQCPMMRFVGRSNRTCDMVGEKLCEHFVRQCIQSALHTVGANALVAMLVPCRSKFVEFFPNQPAAADSTQRWYYFVVGGELSADHRHRLVEQLEERLAENDYYRHARSHGQLRPLRLFHFADPSQLADAYSRYQLSANRRLADVKLTSLCVMDGLWAGGH